MTRRDIVDEIDALIDDQLAAGENGMARRAAAASDRRCPHCNRDWHGLAITARMEEMRREYELRTQRRLFAAYMAGEVGEADYAESAILDDYRYADDTSDILCPGSEFIGPMPSTMRRYECQCANCRAMRSYTRIRARALQDPIVDEPFGYIERFASNPESPWVAYSPGGLIRPRWWRLDLTQYSAETNITINLDQAEISSFGRTFMRHTNTLIILVGEGFARYQAYIRLYEDQDRNVFREEWELDSDRHDSGRRTAIEIHAINPDDCGGHLVWHELDGPNGNYLHSRAVEPADTLPDMLDQLGVSFLLTNRYQAPGWIRDELDTSFDRLLETLGDPGFLTRALNGAEIDTRPYGAVYEPVDGDRVGVDIRGNTVVGTVRNVDTTNGTTTFDLTPDNLTDRGWQPFGTISPDTADAFISETTEPVFDEPARWPPTPPNRATRRGQQEPREPFWTRIRPSRRRRHP